MEDRGRMDVATFFSLLFDEACGADHRISICSAPSFHAQFAASPDEAAKLTAETAATHDTYFGVGLYRPGITSGRGTADDVTCIVGLWADVDFGTEHKKPGLPPTINDATAVISRIGLRPSGIIHSGHGLQPWWLLKEPMTIADGAASLAKRWGETVKAAATSIEFAVDGVWDLARVMRAPGTTNHKREPVKVRWAGQEPPLRYDVDDIDAACVVEEYQPELPTTVTPVAFFEVGGARSISASEIDRLKANDEKFKATWEHTRKDLDGSQSAYDLALAHVGVQAGWSDQRIADLIRENRLARNDNPAKGSRRDYLVRTLGKARASHEADRALNELTRGVRAPDRDNPDDPQRAKILDAIGKAIGVPITRFVRFGGDEGTYFLHLGGGAVVDVGGIANVRERAGERMLARIQDVAGVVPNRFKAEAWGEIQRHLWSVREDDVNTEDTAIEKARHWVGTYIRRTTVYSTPEDAVRHRRPLLRKGRIHVLADELSKFVNEYIAAERLSKRELTGVLKQAGFELTSVNPKAAGLQSCTFWRDSRMVLGEDPQIDHAVTT